MGCADVCLDHGYDEGNEFFDQRFQVARKPWSCTECERPIPAKQKYEYSVGKNEGFMFSKRTCLVCSEIRDAFVCGSFIFGMLWESIEESIFPRWGEEGPFDCLAKLSTPEARSYIQQRYEDWNDDED